MVSGTLSNLRYGRTSNRGTRRRHLCHTTIGMGHKFVRKRAVKNRHEKLRRAVSCYVAISLGRLCERVIQFRNCIFLCKFNDVMRRRLHILDDEAADTTTRFRSNITPHPVIKLRRESVECSSEYVESSNSGLSRSTYT